MKKRPEKPKRHTLTVDLGERGAAIIAWLAEQIGKEWAYRTPTPSGVVRAGLERLASMHMNDAEYLKLPRWDKRVATMPSDGDK